ncbi:two-component system, NtrC family, C4-dicarboxylate transport response regulator DctD [Sphingomonas sp. NFR04]|uniref:sigma-54-dependent transcriptional regulator n=1 Tax=Sphingomonas sp. NFR04 TaxID=1566283 RepID=UPI0008E3780A|nr:sigma-54 dependent transcriptional regulator [Sphingomonas sp. NFR04]SFK50108.1 two-component system, NtrC family, C4-dicarboxylate transport response regulator DctD [Sphingomonas sp. NFR04]
MSVPVALVDDDADFRAALIQLLTLAGHDVRPFVDAPSALAAIDRDFPGVVVTDVRMPGMSGVDFFHRLRAVDPELPVILMTGHGDVAMAVDAIKAGAWDFLTKPFPGDALGAALQRAGTARTLALENRRLRAATSESDTALLGEAPAIRRLREMIPVLADAALDLVLEGATGTGKELYARLVHRAGRRARHRFQAIDCATLPPGIDARALFARDGLVARADRGTLFLDHLDLAPPELHHRLAQFAEARTVATEQRDPESVDVRIIAAIGEGGAAALPAGLYHRLAGVPLRLPPLAERREDVPLLFAHLAQQAAQRHRRPAPPLSEAAHAAARRDWPGNVRELERAAERFVLGLEPAAESVPTEARPLTERLEAFERSAILDAIAAADGEINAAIAALGLPRKTFYYRVKRLGIDLRRARGVE